MAAVRGTTVPYRFSFAFYARRLIVSAVMIVPLFVQLPAQDDRQADDKYLLAQILGRSEEYCFRLGNVALDFVCIEEVTERMCNISQRILRSARWFTRMVEKTDWTRHNLVYDYQYVKKKGRIKEKRLLIKENGRKSRKEETRLKTQTFDYRNVLFGPLNLLDQDRQFFFHFKLLGSELIHGENAFIVQAVPKAGVETGFPWGKIWVSEKFFTVLKIEWSQAVMVQTEIIKNRAKRMNAKPLISSCIEFEYEKNGIRFPSRFLIEEAYLNKRGRTDIMTKLLVIYRDYKFFTVETDIKY